MSKVAKAGKLLCIDHGEYSDYDVRGFFVVLREFDPQEQLAAYLKEHEDQRESYNFNDDEFIALLIRNGLLLEIEYSRLFTGSYGNTTDFDFTE